MACPQCREDLVCSACHKENGEIKEGVLKCKNQHSFPIRNFLPYFSEQKSYVEAFDLIWKCKFTQLGSKQAYGKMVEKLTREEFFKYTGLNPAELNGKLVLDVGCGGGRFIKYLNRFGAEIVGIDLLKIALTSCREQFENDKKTHFVQADLFNLPFKYEIFDFIYSFGVLHHTPYPKKAFAQIVNFLKREGRIAIWLYSKDDKTYTSDILRPITRRIPKRLLWGLGLVITGSYGPILKIPKLGNRIKNLFYRIRLPWHDYWDWRLHSFLDWYGPSYQSKHSYSELKNWFEESGLTDITLCSHPVSAIGKKATNIQGQV